MLCADKPGLLAHISQSFTDQGVNIIQAHCRATEDGRAVNTFHASVRDLDQLKQVIRSLSRIKGVFSVDRVTPTSASVDGRPLGPRDAREVDVRPWHSHVAARRVDCAGRSQPHRGRYDASAAKMDRSPASPTNR